MHNDCVYAKCVGCVNTLPRYLGTVHCNPEHWRDNTVHINTPFLDQKHHKLAEELAAWADSSAAPSASGGLIQPCVLGIRSCMGTGKSTMLKFLLKDMFTPKQVHGAPKRTPPTAVFVTHRTTLAHNIMSKLGDLGFVLYSDKRDDKRDMLHNRNTYPRVIVQLESLHRCAEPFTFPRFDIVIIDESESLFPHFGSPTLKG